MNRITSIGTRRFLAVFLSLCLILPGAALADGKNGKKNFKEGVKYEQQQQWDMAAQHFALALSAEPNNPEYRIHYLQALQRASLMYVSRGDALADQNDYSSAYNAYRQAYNYDQGNEIARFKMERMLDLQKSQAGGGNDQIKYNTKTGAVTLASNEIQVASRARARGEVAQTVAFKDSSFKAAVSSLGKQLGLNVVFDDSVKESEKVSIDLQDVTLAKALDVVLMQKRHTFEQVDRRTIFIYPDNGTNRPRFEKLMIMPFYLGNISAQTAKTVLAQMLPPGRQVASVDMAGGPGGAASSNVLIVKATPAELQLVQDLIKKIDKNKNEVVLDIEIYEVSHDSLFQIGNQIATAPRDILSTEPIGSDPDTKEPIFGRTPASSLTSLGGFGSRQLLPGTFGNIGVLSAFGASGAGFLLGLPPSTLSLLQSKGNSKLLHKTQIHVLDGGQNKTKVGRSVPVRLGTQNFGGGFGGGLNVIGNLGQGGTGNTTGNNLQNLLGGLGGLGGFNNGFDSIQYRDVGLVIDATPTITNEGYVEIKMNFETSDVVASGSDAQNLTPVFTQRSLSTVARIQDGVTSVVAGVNQESKGDSRAGVPVLGMLPLIGRLFTTPRQESRQSDVIITVTPHIIRSAGITKDDHLALVGPPQQGTLNQSIEDVVNRAQVEEEQERRLIAQGMPGVQLDAPAQAPINTQQASFGNPPRQGSSAQPVNFGGQQRQGAGTQSVVQPVYNQGNSGNRNQRAVNDQPIGASRPSPVNPSVSVPAVPETSIPEVPLNQSNGNTGSDIPQQGQPGQPGQPGQAGQGGQPGQEAGKDGAGATPDLSQFITQPAEPVPQAMVVASRRPENVDRAIARMMAEEKARMAAEAANKSKQPEPQPDIPQEYLNLGPQQKVAIATPKMSPGTRGSAAVNFSLSPKPIRQRVGKTFTVTVEVSSQEQMSGASVALSYDASKLEVKSVRDGGLFGAQPEFGYDIKQKGVLIVNVKQPQNSPTAASGRLITIEFSAIGEGQSEISIDRNETRVRIGGAQIPAGGASTQVIISRDSAKSSNGK